MHPNDSPIEMPFSHAPRIDLVYAMKVLRRTWRLALLSAAIVLFIGLSIASVVKDVFHSSVVAIYDRHDTLTTSIESGLIAGNDGIDSSFDTRMTDPDFLLSLTKSVPVETDGRIGRFLMKLGLNPPRSEADEKAHIQDYFAKHLIPNANGGNGQLTVNVYIDGSPERAQELAAMAMELFIVRELSAASNRIGIKIDLLERAFAKSRQRIQDLKKTEKHKTTTNDKNAQSEQVSMPVRQLEAELTDRIKAAEAEFTQRSEEMVRRKTLLESEFQRLSARLSPNHPELLAKRRELDLLNSGPDPLDEATRNLRNLRRELWSARTDLLMPGLNGGDGSSSLEERLAFNQLFSLQQTISELSIEKEGLERQVIDAASRMRLKIFRPASYEPRPYKRGRMQVSLATIALSLFVALAMIFWQESSSPLARDAWRVARFTGLEVLSQLSTASMAQFPVITPQSADALRGKLSSLNPEDRIAIKTLLAYRKAELILRRKCKGNVVCFIGAGASDVTSNFMSNLANIIATDVGGPVLVIDGHSRDPLIPIDAQGDAPDFIDCLMGHCSWRATVNARNSERAFDALAVTKPVIGERTRAFRSRDLVRVLREISNAYEFVVIRGLPESMFIENDALVEASSDVILGIDATRTEYDELARTIANLNLEKLRGLILIGT